MCHKFLVLTVYRYLVYCLAQPQRWWRQPWLP